MHEPKQRNEPAALDRLTLALWRARHKLRSTWRHVKHGASTDSSSSALPLVYWPAHRSHSQPSMAPPVVAPPVGPETGLAARTGWISAAGGVAILVVILAAWQGPALNPESADRPPTNQAAAEIDERTTARAGTRQEVDAVAAPPAPAPHSAREAYTPISQTDSFLTSGGTAVLLKEVEPVYPDAARRAGIQGLVVVTYSLDPNGRPTTLKVTKSVPGLDDAALAALRQWQYTRPPAGSTQKYRFNAEFVLDGSGGSGTRIF